MSRIKTIFKEDKKAYVEDCVLKLELSINKCEIIDTYSVFLEFTCVGVKYSEELELEVSVTFKDLEEETLRKACNRMLYVLRKRQINIHNSAKSYIEAVFYLCHILGGINV